MRNMAIKLGLMILQCNVEEFVEQENWAAALKACADFAPEMNAYMDIQEGRQEIVLKRWKEICDFAAGADLRKVA